MPAKPKRAARYAPAQRLEILKQALVARAMTIEDMMELLEMSRASVYRKLDVLSATEELSQSERDGRAYYRIAPPKVASLRCSLSELVALDLACRMLEMHAGTGIKEDLDALRERIAATLRNADATMAKDLDRKIFCVPSPGKRRYDDRLDDVNDVVTATLHQHRLDVTYASPKAGARAKTFRFEPYTLLLYKLGLYLAGFSHHPEHKKVIKLALDHCKDVAWRRGDAFEYPAGYHPRQLVDGAFGLHAGDVEETVRIRFSAAVRGYVERGEWHASTERFEASEDGGVVLTMRVKGTTEIASWVLSFGANAEVLEPPALRAEVARAARAMAAAYG